MNTEADDNVLTRVISENPSVDASKKDKSGVVYLSSIPTDFTVLRLRETLTDFGEVGRIFLQPKKEQSANGRRFHRKFEEGWVEFLQKNDAKSAANALNNNQVGGKRRHKWYYDLWNIKYLSKFKWSHLMDQLESERMLRKQKLRLAISQTKREVDFFSKNLDQKKKRERQNRKRLKENLKSTDNNDDSVNANGAAEEIANRLKRSQNLTEEEKLKLKAARKRSKISKKGTQENTRYGCFEQRKRLCDDSETLSKLFGD